MHNHLHYGTGDTMHISLELSQMLLCMLRQSDSELTCASPIRFVCAFTCRVQCSISDYADTIICIDLHIDAPHTLGSSHALLELYAERGNLLCPALEPITRAQLEPLKSSTHYLHGCIVSMAQGLYLSRSSLAHTTGCIVSRACVMHAAGAGPFPEGVTMPGDHLRKVFYRMGFNDQEIVALSGAQSMHSQHCPACLNLPGLDSSVGHTSVTYQSQISDTMIASVTD